MLNRTGVVLVEGRRRNEWNGIAMRVTEREGIWGARDLGMGSGREGSG
jgi:hypothetical protein